METREMTTDLTSRTSAYSGEEPLYDPSYTLGEGIDDITSHNYQWTKIFNWYSYRKNTAHARKFVVDYMKTKPEFEMHAGIMASLPCTEFKITVGWVARQAVLCAKRDVQVELPPRFIAFLDSAIRAWIAKPQENNVVVLPKVHVVSEKHIPISEHIKAQIDDAVDGILGHILNGEEFSLHEFMIQHKWKGMQAATLKSRIRKDLIARADFHLGKKSKYGTGPFRKALERFIPICEEWKAAFKKPAVVA